MKTLGYYLLCLSCGLVITDEPNREMKIVIGAPAVNQIDQPQREMKIVIGTPVDKSMDSMVLINDYADSLLKDLSTYLEKNEYSTVNLPDYNKTFQVAFFSGVINLQNGKLNNLNTIVRLNDSTVTYTYPHLRLYVPMKSTALNINYTYTAQVMGMKPTGTVHGNITNCEMVIDVGLSLTNLRATLFELRVKKLTGVSLAFQGSGFFTSIVNGIKNMLVPTIEEFLPQKFEEFLLDLVHNKFSNYNSTICETLEDC